MNQYYTVERNVQIVIALLKAHGIRKIVASPGTTNITFSTSLKHDPYFEMYSAADERSAAYIACGLAAESGEPVVISCTGATASRNYMPGLTEAFYRKLPVLSVTSTQHSGRVGNNCPQVIDRSVCPKDIVKISVELPSVHTEEDEWTCAIRANRAILELTRHGGGPAHINLTSLYARDYSVKEIPPVQVINRICQDDKFPELPQVKIAIWCCTHAKWSSELTEAVDKFCSLYDAVIFCDHTSNYHGKYAVHYSLACSQVAKNYEKNMPDVIIHLGEITGDYPLMAIAKKSQIWRVSPDGEIKDPFRKLRYVFEMNEDIFFKHYIVEYQGEASHDEYLNSCRQHLLNLYSSLPELPFSNIWIASVLSEQLPENAVIHFGILNSLRAWNLFKIPQNINAYSNTGGFGIDGNISSLIGASLYDKNKLYYEIVGDLAFFYDLNSLGNRHIGKNLRILLVNNGKGVEMMLNTNPGAELGDEVEVYVAASGHYGRQSADLVKHYAEDLGFKYFTASNKEDFLKICPRFVSVEKNDKSIIFEVFTQSRDDQDALTIMQHIEKLGKGMVKDTVKKMIGIKGIQLLRGLKSDN